MNPHFFGQTDNQLFGVYHRPRGNPQQPVRAVVICAPIGQEFIRSHWCLRLLAGQLERKGIHVLRFDYRGTGDSAGSCVDIDSIGRWQADIQTAIAQMQQLSDAESVMLLGLRAGATFAAQLSEVSANVNSMLLWEPVVSGESYLRQLGNLHAEMLDLWVCKMETENTDAAEEIVGSSYSKQLLQELEELRIDWNNIRQPHLVIDVETSQDKYNLNNNPMRKIEFSMDESSWTDLRQLETAWMRPQTTRTIVTHAADMFDRLERFGVVGNLSMAGV